MFTRIKMAKILWLFCLIFGAYAQTTTLEIFPDRSFSRVIENSNVTVVCRVENLEGKTVRWSHNNREIALVANGNNIVFLDPNDRSKYSLRGDSSAGGNFSFTIHSVSIDDISDVVCKINDVPPESHFIDVYKFPKQVLLFPNRDETILDGASAMSEINIGVNASLNLSCLVLDSRPAANVTWLWNDTEFNSQLFSTAAIEMQGLFNTTSFLFLPPAYFRDLIFANNSTGQLEDSTFEPTTVSSNWSETIASETQRLFENQTSSSEVSEEYVSLKPLISMELDVVVTCQAEVENRTFSSSALIHIGRHEERNSSSSILLRRSELLFLIMFVLEIVFAIV